MTMTCEQAQEHLDARALGALDRDDARGVDAHLDTCADCTGLARLSDETAASLALSVPLHRASAELKSRIMASARVVTDIRSPRPATTPWYRAPSFFPSAVAAVMVLGVGTIAWGTFTQMQVNDLESTNASIARGATAQASELAIVRAQATDASAAVANVQDDLETQELFFEVVSQPDAEQTLLSATADAPGATARCIWSKAQAIGAFLADNLPEAPADGAYHVWVIYERGWENAGTLAMADNGKGKLFLGTLATSTAALGAVRGFALTMESDSRPKATPGKVLLTSVAP